MHVLQFLFNLCIIAHKQQQHVLEFWIGVFHSLDHATFSCHLQLCIHTTLLFHLWICVSVLTDTPLALTL